MLVVDASVLAPALADDTSDGDAARRRLRGESLIALELIDLEVASVFRKQLATQDLDARRARLPLADLVDAPIEGLADPQPSLPDRATELIQARSATSIPTSLV